MSTSNQVESPYICPRCSAVLPPGEATCYSCGYQLAPEQSGRTPQSVQSSTTPATGKVRSRKRNPAAFMYFMSVFLVIVLFAFLLLHAAGISLSTFFPHAAATVPYPVPDRPPLFSDSFLSDANGWNLQSSPGNYTVTVGEGALTLGIEQHKLLWELVPGERSYSDFILTVNAVLAQGDQNNGYGVYIRGTANPASDLATYYRFEVYGDGSYAIFKGIAGPGSTSTSTVIAGYTLNSAIQPQGKLNKLMIIARGATLSFVVNGQLLKTISDQSYTAGSVAQLLKTISDQSYTAGSVALFVSNLPQAKPGAQIKFSQFAIYPAQA